MRQRCSRAWALPSEVGPPARSTTDQRVVAKTRAPGFAADAGSLAAIVASLDESEVMPVVTDAGGPRGVEAGDGDGCSDTKESPDKGYAAWRNSRGMVTLAMGPGGSVTGRA